MCVIDLINKISFVFKLKESFKRQMASELLHGLRLLLVSKRLSIQIIKNHCAVTYDVVSYSAKLIKRLKLSTTTRKSFAFYQKTINDFEPILINHLTNYHTPIVKG